jgi:hypothetical protein
MEERIFWNTAWIRIGFVLALLMLCCSCSVDQTFVAGVDAGWDVIGPEYTAYVEGDPKLDPDSKATRKRTAELMSLLIEEAQK